MKALNLSEEILNSLPYEANCMVHLINFKTQYDNFSTQANVSYLDNVNHLEQVLRLNKIQIEELDEEIQKFKKTLYARQKFFRKLQEEN